MCLQKIYTGSIIDTLLKICLKICIYIYKRKLWEYFQAVAVSVLLYGCTIKTGEKVRYELQNTAVCCFEQILEAAPHKTGAI